MTLAFLKNIVSPSTLLLERTFLILFLSDASSLSWGFAFLTRPWHRWYCVLLVPLLEACDSHMSLTDDVHFDYLVFMWLEFSNVWLTGFFFFSSWQISICGEILEDTSYSSKFPFKFRICYCQYSFTMMVVTWFSKSVLSPLILTSQSTAFYCKQRALSSPLFIYYLPLTYEFLCFSTSVFCFLVFYLYSLSVYFVHFFLNHFKVSYTDHDLSPLF